MEQANSPSVTEMLMRKGRGIFRLFFAIVTADVFLAILRHWRGFDGGHQLVAGGLLLLLVWIPLVAIWKRTETTQRTWANLIPAYTLLMLATDLFGR
jgi:hypothetical protein